MVTVFIFQFQAPHDKSEDGDEDSIEYVDNLEGEDIINDGNNSIDDAYIDEAGDGRIAEVCDIARLSEAILISRSYH